ncbi:MAG: 23S rRNA (pseudouridine(1915)-N(3))-methyltransferase RlmH [Verrucomicrobiota bacterium]
MKCLVLAAGKPALAYAKAGIAEYLKRLSRYGGVDLVYVKDGAAEAVSARLLEKSKGCLRIALDERGASPTTREWAAQFEEWALRGEAKRVAFLVGASEGHSEGLRQECDLVWSLSALTLQHELALLVLLEQLYRVQTLRRGEPYHR